MTTFLSKKYERFGSKQVYLLLGDKAGEVPTAIFTFKEDKYPELIACIYDQLLKDGFKVVGMETKSQNLSIFDEKSTIFEKARYLFKSKYAPLSDRIKEVTQQKIHHYLVHTLKHDTYGEIIIKVHDNRSISGFSLETYSIYVNATDETKKAVTAPYMKSLFTGTKITDCLENRLFPPKKRPIGIFTISDYDVYNEIFKDYKFRSTCPICLTTQPKDPQSCRYTYHVCNQKDLKHPDQKKLYDMFKAGPQNEISWCASCGRICKSHGHFNIVKIEDVLSGAVVPQLLPGEFNVFSVDCKPYGGGFLEKFIRCENLLRESAKIQKLGGGITLADAKIRLVKALWNGPLVITDQPTIAILNTMKFTVSRDKFSTPGTEIAPMAPQVEITRDPADMALLPEKIEDPNNICYIEGGKPDDNRPVWKFKHRKRDGTVHEHTNELTCDIDFMAGLTQGMHETNGKCFLNVAECDATIHPFEVKHMVGADDPSYILYEKFYRERIMAGGGIPVQESVFPKGPKFESACPIPKKAGFKKRKTYKSKSKKVRNTRRNKHKK